MCVRRASLATLSSRKERPTATRHGCYILYTSGGKKPKKEKKKKKNKSKTDSRPPRYIYYTRAVCAGVVRLYIFSPFIAIPFRPQSLAAASTHTAEQLAQSPSIKPHLQNDGI
jgi:hypothetical protein